MTRFLPPALSALFLFLSCFGASPEASAQEQSPVLRTHSLVSNVPSRDDEIIKEFRKYFRKFKDVPSRVEAVMSLDGTDSPAMVKVLLPILKDKEPEVADAAISILAGAKSRTAVDAIFIALLEKKDEPTRLGLLRVIATGGLQGDDEALIACLSDKSWRIRYRVIQALAARKELKSVPRFIELTKDKEPAVRCAAMEALGDFHEEAVIDIGIKALGDKTWQVRSSAAKVLLQVRAQRAIAPLITAMEEEDGRLLKDYSLALEEITGKYFGMRTAQWRKWWTQIENRFKIPTNEQLAKTKAKRAENAALYSPPGTTSYHGIDSPSRRVLYIIDVSGSMEANVIDRERFQEGDYPSMSRIDIVKTELQRTIERLESYVEINILAFATKVKPWKKSLVKCNVLNKRSAIDWVGRLEALGGTSKEGLARAGLTGAANLEAGKTNTYGVLMRALDVAGRGTHDQSYEIAVDTIFFLSDGRPTVGELVDPDDILREVKVANELRKVVIHTIALGEFQKEFMKTLARQNNGVFVDLGR
jgi:hypothetical protein